ncbi:MAG: cytochrome P450, partial [Actinomycetota bacterium]|nr:cytochrome P450 [Actinomycetota bacterium]
MTKASLPPGPRLPGPAQAVLWGLRYPQFTRAGHQRFGATFTIKPGTMAPIVLTTDRDAIRRLLTGDPLAKHHGNDAVRPLVGDRSVLLLEPAQHLARRKLLLPPFHGERVRAYAELMQRLMDAEVDRWRSGDTVAVLPIAQNVTIEVILQAVLGVADVDTRREFRRLIDNTLFYPLGALRLRLSRRLTPRRSPPRRVRELAAFVAALPTPAVLTYFPETKTRSRLNLAIRPWWRHRDRLFALLDEQVAMTRADSRLAERDDVLAMLVQARDEESNTLTSEDLRNDLVALIGAGHETTAAAIGWGATLLAHNPDVCKRATQAARENDEEYLGALVKEVLRIRPPLPVAAGRVLEEPFAIGPHAIPAGTLIMIDAWGLHHDPQVYPDPERFEPERFLGAAPEPYTWLPFGGGAHRCIGSALAELEIRVALTTILNRVAIAPADTELAPPARRAVT